MLAKQKQTILLVITSAALTTLLAFVFGNDGYEAFVIACLGLGILISRQTLALVLLKRRWAILQIFIGLLVAFAWFVQIMILVFALSPQLANPSLDAPSVNWLIVALGLLPFLIRAAHSKARQDQTAILTHFVILMYSAITFFVASFVYYEAKSQLIGLILVVAVQMQYIMSYILMHTDYIKKTHAWIAHKTKDERLISLIVGLPLFIPLVIIVLMGLL